MPNTVNLNPAGYVEAIIEGDQNKMSFEYIHYEAADLLEALGKTGKPQIGLIDVTKQGKFTPDSNKAAMEILETLQYDRLALFGAGKVLGEVIKGIILAMGKNDKTKLFHDRESALAWLQELSAQPKS